MWTLFPFVQTHSPLKEALDAIDALENDFDKENVDGNSKLASPEPTAPSEYRRSVERSEVLEEPCVERIFPMLGSTPGMAA